MDPTVLAPALLSKIIPKEERAQALELAKLDLISGFADVVLGHISLSFSFSTLRKATLGVVCQKMVPDTASKKAARTSEARIQEGSR